MSYGDTLSIEQEKALLANLQQLSNSDAHDIILMALNTGLRRGEIERLRWSDVDLAGAMISVKTRELSRAIPLSPELVGVLKERAGKSGAEFVLGSCPKNAMRKVMNALHRAAIAARMSGLSWHVLRRTFATRLINADMSPVVLAKIMGLSSPFTAMKVLCRWDSEQVCSEFLKAMLNTHPPMNHAQVLSTTTRYQAKGNLDPR